MLVVQGSVTQQLSLPSLIFPHQPLRRAINIVQPLPTIYPVPGFDFRDISEPVPIPDKTDSIFLSWNDSAVIFCTFTHVMTTNVHN